MLLEKNVSSFYIQMILDKISVLITSAKINKTNRSLGVLEALQLFSTDIDSSYR